MPCLSNPTSCLKGASYGYRRSLRWSISFTAIVTGILEVKNVYEKSFVDDVSIAAVEEEPAFDDYPRLPAVYE